MGTTTASIYLAQHLNLFPAPLHIRRKSRKLIFRRLAQRRITYGRTSDNKQYGPLDDIIDEITGDIWGSVQDYDLDHIFEWPPNLGAEFPWSVAPLPVSRIPSDQPLSVRKTRYSNSNSRSTESSSTVSEAMVSFRSRSSSKSDYDRSSKATNRPPRSSLSSSNRPTISAPEILSLDTTPSRISLDMDHTATTQNLSTVLKTSSGSSQVCEPRPQQPLRKRLFSLSNSMGKMRLKSNTNDATKADNLNTSLPPGLISESLSATGTKEEADEADDSIPQTTEAVAAWISTHAKRTSIMTPLCSQVAKQFPSPHELRYDRPEDSMSHTNSSSPLLTTVVRVLPEMKVLNDEEEQTFWVAVEVESVVTSRPHPGAAIDVVFVLDNSYYVTDDCLNRALSLMSESLNQLEKCDRVALYTTHCTHENVSGTIPDMWYPLSPAEKVSIAVVREMASDIRALGTQTWKPPRPNPSIDDTLISIAKSLSGKEPKEGQSHIMLLSPIGCNVIEVSKAYPAMEFHMINPAIIPIAKEIRSEDGPGNATMSNYTYYQSRSESIKKILRYARSKKPAGRSCNIHIDVRRRPGCEVLHYEGSTDVPHLQLGQVHTFFAEIRVYRSQTQEMDLMSRDPVRDSILAKNNIKQDLLNAKALGACKVHLLSVQVMHQNTIMQSDEWVFTETPLFIIKDIGRLTWPTDRAMEVYKRRFFRTINQLDPDVAIKMIDQLDLMVKPELKEKAKKKLDRIRNEIEAHRAIILYEKNSRRNLPFCAGPIAMPQTHQFLVEKWEVQKRKR